MTVFGPGYGESVLVHLGAENWLVVDSCETPEKEPAAFRYLKELSVAPKSVRLLVASHWHDDHVRGFSKLVEYFSDAELFVSDVFTDEEALVFLGAFAGLDGLKLSRGTKELFSSISQRGRATKFAAQRNVLLSQTINGHSVQVMAFSPTDAAKSESKQRFAAYVPSERDPVNVAPELDRNIESVVLHVRIGGDILLLGADLEDYKDLGWSAVVADSVCIGQGKAALYKIAHHGSITGEHSQIWGLLLENSPIASLTPFLKGRVALPKDEDKVRIRSKTRQAFISSNASKKPSLDWAVEKRLGDICSDLSVANPGFGAVRFRKAVGARDWSHELFGSAQKL